MIEAMNREPSVWVVGRLDGNLAALLDQSSLHVQYALTWSDFDELGAFPDALIVAPLEQDSPGFARVVERYAQVPLVILDRWDGPLSLDAEDRSLIAHPRHAEDIIAFLSSHLARRSGGARSRRCRVPALVRDRDASFVGRLVAISDVGATVTLPGHRIGLFEVEIALLTSGPYLRFEARVERHLRTDSETHLGIVWRHLSTEHVRWLIQTIESDEASGAALSSGAFPVRRLRDAHPMDADCLPDWVERALAELVSAGGWGERVLRGRMETAIQLSSCSGSVPPRLQTQDL